MSDNPISNPGTPPIQPASPYGPEKPSLGAGEEGQEPKPFSLGPEGGKTLSSEPAGSEKPSPMQVAGDAARQGPQIPPEELEGKIVNLQTQLETAHNQLQNPNITQRFSPEHHEALQKLTQKMNPDMQNIAKFSNGQFAAPQQKSGTSVLDYVAQWINGSQQTLSGALNYLQNTKKPNIADYMRLQYAVQRASQRGELFASIVGSSVSGIKTIMSTQLG